MKIHDISISIDNNTVVYPGNSPVVISDYARIPESSSNLSKIEMGSHTATHVDAPFHADNNWPKLGQIPLEKFVGPAKVFDFSYLQAGEAIKISDFENAEKSAEKIASETADETAEKLSIQKGDRILVKTSNSARGFNEFYDDFVYLDDDTAKWLADKEIALFGIDYLSVKQKGSKDNRPHTELLSKEIAIVEGLNLKEISSGQYQLFCLPLKIDNIDGAPARAILIDNN